MDRSDGFAGARFVEGKGQPRADCEGVAAGVAAGDSLLAQRAKRAVDVPVGTPTEEAGAGRCRSVHAPSAKVEVPAKSEKLR